MIESEAEMCYYCYKSYRKTRQRLVGNLVLMCKVCLYGLSSNNIAKVLSGLLARLLYV